MSSYTPNAGKGDKYYGTTASNYEKRRKKQAWWHVEQAEMESLLEKLPNGLRVVDIPFGTGRFVPYYIDKGFDVSGLDASSAMLEAAQKAIGSDFEKCAVTTGFSTDLPFEDEEFDLLVSTRFLRDIIPFRDAKTSLAEFARVTKKYAIIQLGHSITGNTEPDENFTMGSLLSEEKLTKLLEDYGFSILEKRLVQTSEEENSRIFHFLLEKL